MSNCVWATNCQELKSSLQASMKEHDYMGMSSHQSSERWPMPPKPGPTSVAIENLTETDLRLGLGPPQQPSPLKQEAHYLASKDLMPRESVNRRGTEVPARGSAIEPESACPDNAAKYGVKRGYAAAALPLASSQSGSPVSWAAARAAASGTSTGTMKNNSESSAKQAFMTTHADNPRQGNQSDTLPQKANVVGWPPIGPFRKNALPTNKEPIVGAKGLEDNDGNQASLYVKVNMDGVPVGRKVDLQAYHSYEGLSQALKDMFHLPTHGEYSQNLLFGVEKFERSFRFLPGLKLTYEDKDGDWMLVGDVPWSMFARTVRRLHIMKESATGK